MGRLASKVVKGHPRRLVKRPKDYTEDKLSRGNVRCGEGETSGGVGEGYRVPEGVLTKLGYTLASQLRGGDKVVTFRSWYERRLWLEYDMWDV